MGKRIEFCILACTASLLGACGPSDVEEPTPTLLYDVALEYVVTSSPLECCSAVSTIYIWNYGYSRRDCLSISADTYDAMWDMDLPAVGDTIYYAPKAEEQGCGEWSEMLPTESYDSMRTATCLWTTDVGLDIYELYQLNDQPYLGATLFVDQFSEDGELDQTVLDLLPVPETDLGSASIVNQWEEDGEEYTTYKYTFSIPDSLIDMIFTLDGEVQSSLEIGVTTWYSEPNESGFSAGWYYYMDSCTLQ